MTPIVAALKYSSVKFIERRTVAIVKLNGVNIQNNWMVKVWPLFILLYNLLFVT